MPFVPLGSLGGGHPIPAHEVRAETIGPRFALPASDER